MDSITYDFSDNPHMLAVIRAFITKRRHEKELADSREVWADAMIEARNAGVTIADMSRATGVASPSIINVINTALAKRPVVATEATEG
jgi:lambda repressor-like predicted transcriptional regulator